MKKGDIPLVGIIMDVFTIVLILFIAALIFIFFMNSSSPPICSFSSYLRNFYHSACMNVGGVEIMCLADLTTFEVPLMGCNPVVTNYGEMDASNFAKQLGLEAQACWVKYGSGGINVLWAEGENPAICSEISATINNKIDSAVISNAWSNISWGSTYDCTACDNPCDEGYECDLADKSKCMKQESDPFECRRNGFLPECASGYYNNNYFAGNEGEPAFDENMDKLCGNLSNYVCSGDSFYVSRACCSDGYSPPDENGLCDGAQPERWKCVTQMGPKDYVCVGDAVLPEDICRVGEDITGTSTIVDCIYCQGENHGYKPNQCLLTKNVEKKECYKTISLADFLEPGLKTIYSFKNSSDEAIVIGNLENTFSLSGRVHAFVEYIDSFTGVGKTSGIRVLPPECSAAYFVDTCDMCEDECIGGIFQTLMLYQGSRGLVGATGVGVGAVYTQSPDAGNFIISAFVGYAGNVISRIQQCGMCLAQGTAEAVGFSPDIVACSDKMLICLYGED
jgi:hypothetical protein